jgi:hypothetical protein
MGGEGARRTVALENKRSKTSEALPDTADFRIVLNYRRDDAAGHAGHLYDDLSEHFGDDHVFIDIDTIKPGEPFAEVIDRAVGSADAFLALIGRRWLTATDAKGRRRLDSPADFVRLEIEAALTRKMLVIPVLLQGAEMPSSDDLPETVSGLAGIHAHEISDSRWRYDVTQLIAILDNVQRQKQAEEPPTVAASAPPVSPQPPAVSPQPPPVSPQPRRFATPRRALLAGAGLAGVALVALLLALLLGGNEEPEPGPPTEPSPNAPLPSSLDGLIYARNGRIFRIDGRKLVDLTEGSRPDWSRAGRKIAFVNDSRIWVMNEDGNDRNELITGPDIDNAPAWSPNGDELFFDRKREGDPRSNVWKVTVDGDRAGTPTQVTDTGGGAPDVEGTGKIAFQHAGAIYIRDGTDEQNITDEMSGSLESVPAWSPDGEEIAFRVVQREERDIWLMDRDGSAKNNLTRGLVPNANNPTWSSDGRWIVITATDGIWITDRNGKTLERVVTCKQGSDVCRVVTSPNL